jgi:NAD+ diphosphatase
VHPASDSEPPLVASGEFPLAYCDPALDRSADRRISPEWVASLVTERNPGVLVLWRDRCLLDGDSHLVMIEGAAARELLTGTEQAVLLGLAAGEGVFAVDLTPLDEADALRRAGARSTAEVRDVAGELSAPDAARLAYARGLLYWHRNTRFCGTCGNPTVAGEAGHSRICANDACGKLLFPRIEPAVIVLVESPGPPPRCLLARHRKSVLGGYSTLAGFVEIGESLEGAVRREIAEEAGVRVGSVRYQGSQAWPFPSGIMLGFRATAVDDAIHPDGNELSEARWFTREELAALAASDARAFGRGDSIEQFLLRTWLDEGRQAVSRVQGRRM